MELHRDCIRRWLPAIYCQLLSLELLATQPEKLYNCFIKTLAITAYYWVVPENIRTPTTDGILEFRMHGGGGGVFGLEFRMHRGGGVAGIGILNA